MLRQKSEVITENKKITNLFRKTLRRRSLDEQIRDFRFFSIDDYTTDEAKSSDSESSRNAGAGASNYEPPESLKKNKRSKKRGKKVRRELMRKIDSESSFKRFCSTTKQIILGMPKAVINRRKVTVRDGGKMVQSFRNINTENDVVDACYKL